MNNSPESTAALADVEATRPEPPEAAPPPAVGSVGAGAVPASADGDAQAAMHAAGMMAGMPGMPPGMPPGGMPGAMPSGSSATISR